MSETTVVEAPETEETTPLEGEAADEAEGADEEETPSFDAVQAEREHALLNLIAEKREEIRELTRHEESKRLAFKAAKDAREEATDELLTLIDEVNSPSLFFSNNGAVASESQAEEAEDDESWREVDVEGLDLAGGIIDKLHEAGIHTVGDLSDWTSEPNAQLLTDIAGIGTAKAEKIEDALTKFWASRGPVASNEEPEVAEIAVYHSVIYLGRVGEIISIDGEEVHIHYPDGATEISSIEDARVARQEFLHDLASRNGEAEETDDDLDDEGDDAE